MQEDKNQFRTIFSLLTFTVALKKCIAFFVGQVPISMQNPGCDIFIDIFNYSRRSRNLKGAIDRPSLVQLQKFVINKSAKVH